ncbi:Hypothetical predicted protein [Xyrichtys novacula]|uniref:Uncharacterized protein n=1 Tax=Xyrichtys novacula TaxID=13765 RepID=A0AAV1G5M7_XYRNO|nr:Hypothetical predicted protein [Xyrichtys novacula]
MRKAKRNLRERKNGPRLRDNGLKTSINSMTESVGEIWGPSQAEQVPDQLTGTGCATEEVEEEGSGWRRVKFPCPGGLWGVVVADVTSGPSLPLFLHLCSMSFPPWSHGFLSVLICRFKSITLPLLLHNRQKHNRPQADRPNLF